MFVIIFAACFYIVFAETVEVPQETSPIQAYLQEQRRYEVKKKYLPYYHITTPIGWLNEPAGFVYFAQKYHIFYQLYPFSGTWGRSHWGHVVSDNLVQWHHYPIALYPNKTYDAEDCLSGTALVMDDQLAIFYTGRYTNNNKTVYTQNLATSYDGITFQKFDKNPVLYKTFQKNPNVWKVGSIWYMLLGSTTTDNRGCVVLYRAHDAPYNWTRKAIVAESLGDMGDLWENPDMFKLHGWDVLMMSVRGLKPNGRRYLNRRQTGYVIGRLNYESGKLDDAEVSTLTFNELDHGHDFHAAKTLMTSDGRRLLIGWLGMWKPGAQDFPNPASSGFLTVVRELTMNNNSKILMNPIKEMKKLRKDLLEDAWFKPCEIVNAGRSGFELLVTTPNPTSETAMLSFEWSGKAWMQFSLTYHDKFGTMTVNRGGKDGTRTADWRPDGKILEWRIFVDTHSIEVFCGHGEVVFSSRFFPRGQLKIRIGGTTPLHLKQYRLRRNTVRHDKAVRDLLKKRLRVRKHLTKDDE